MKRSVINFQQKIATLIEDKERLNKNVNSLLMQTQVSPVGWKGQGNGNFVRKFSWGIN